MNSRLALKNNISGINPASPDLGTEGAGNKGTAHCVKLAMRASIEVRRYAPETPATEPTDGWMIFS